MSEMLVRVVQVKCPDCNKAHEVYYVGTWHVKLFCEGCCSLFILMPKPDQPKDTTDD